MAAASALALLIAMFLPWFSLDARVDVQGVPAFAAEQDSLNAWQALGAVDILLLAVVLLVAVAAVTRDPRIERWVTPAGVFALVLIVYRLADPPPLDLQLAGGETEVGREIGLLFALLAAAGIGYGGQRGASARGGI